MVQLSDSITALDGVGPKREAAFNALNIFTIEDLVNYYPYRYEDLGARLPSETLDGEKATFKGFVSAPPVLSRYGYKKTRLLFRLLVEHDNIGVSFFNQPWLAKQIDIGQEVAVYGTYDRNRQTLNGIKMISASTDELAPIYPASKQINAKTIRHLIEVAWADVRDHIPSLVPQPIRKKYHLLTRQKQIEEMHFPKDADWAKAARRSAAFEEFYLFQMRLQLLKIADQQFSGESIDYDVVALKAFTQKLPFTLTAAQQKVSREILQDQKRPIHMNRLLQGDVGSGKTIVAALAMYAVVTAGRQAAMMAPTEILARQHAINLANLFEQVGLSVRVELLTSGMRVAARRHLLEDLVNGDIDILVGTH
ncbi:MAG: DEAD/DEAH box helicase, partial [Leuconostoc fallax]